MNEKTTNNLIKKRYSPLAFSAQAVETQIMMACLDAARWAPSAFNEQPWRFLFVHKHETENFEKIASTLVAGNKEWAEDAAVLMLVMAKTTFQHNGKPNPFHLYDTGMAMQGFLIAAMEHDVLVHQMAGFDADKARENFGIAEDIRLISVAAIGYLGETEALPEHLQVRAKRERTRKSVEELLIG